MCTYQESDYTQHDSFLSLSRDEGIFFLFEITGKCKRLAIIRTKTVRSHISRPQNQKGKEELFLTNPDWTDPEDCALLSVLVKNCLSNVYYATFSSNARTVIFE